MKAKVILISIFIGLITNSLFSQADTIDYLGQTPPGNTPKIFAPDIITSLSSQFHIAIHPKGNEILYTASNSNWSVTNIYIVKKQDGIWSTPEIAPFSNNNHRNLDPSYSPDGNTVYFGCSKNPSGAGADHEDTKLWKVERNGLDWLEPKFIGFGESGDNIYYNNPNLTIDSMLIFGGGEIGTTQSSLYISKMVNGAFPNKEEIKLPIPNNCTPAEPFIDPNEEYLITAIDGLSNSIGSLDFYILYKKDDGSWTYPKNLGAKINSEQFEYGAFVSPDKRFFFYSSFTPGSTRISWVKADFIDSLKHTNFEPYVANEIIKQSGTVGNLFSFTIPDSTFIDDDGNHTLTYSATFNNDETLPAWLSFNKETKILSGTPTERSNFRVYITATDTAGVSAISNFYLTIDKSVTAINQIVEQNIKVYPNPTKDKINITFSSIEYKTAIVEITDIFGRLISSDTYQNLSNSTIDLSGNPKGIYFIKLSIDGEKLSKIICKE